MALIVIIHANPAENQKIESSLSGLRHRLTMTGSATRGLDLARSGNPDLIMVGAQESGADAFTLIATLRKDPITRETAIALLDNNPDPARVAKLRQLGVIDMISPGIALEDLRKKILNALVSADKLRLQHALKRANHVLVKRKPGRTDISILSGLKEYALAEAKVVFNPFFLKLIKNDLVILDIRSIPEIAEHEVRIVEQFASILGGEKVILLAGRHLGLIVSETDLAVKNKVFFSQEEMDAFFASKKKP